mmetsp:Transcript_27321/g.41296  ORF Transcript_27321/g.41296 Transcript_27321/m.41296 type:complete len:94 (-) Transcript_27321:88-369(-)
MWPRCTCFGSCWNYCFPFVVFGLFVGASMLFSQQVCKIPMLQAVGLASFACCEWLVLLRASHNACSFIDYTNGSEEALLCFHDRCFRMIFEKR